MDENNAGLTLFWKWELVMPQHSVPYVGPNSPYWEFVELHDEHSNSLLLKSLVWEYLKSVFRMPIEIQLQITPDGVDK